MMPKGCPPLKGFLQQAKRLVAKMTQLNKDGANSRWSAMPVWSTQSGPPVRRHTIHQGVGVSSLECPQIAIADTNKGRVRSCRARRAAAPSGLSTRKSMMQLGVRGRIDDQRMPSAPQARAS